MPFRTMIRRRLQLQSQVTKLGRMMTSREPGIAMIFIKKAEINVAGLESEGA